MDWIAANADQLGATVLLLIAVFGRFKQWWVDGPTHKEIKDALIESTKATASANAVNARLAQLWIDQHSFDRSTSSSRSEPPS